jgi:hypothetical protein
VVFSDEQGVVDRRAGDVEHSRAVRERGRRL